MLTYLAGGLPAKSKSASGVPETPMSLVLRSHLKTIMDNAESRKIFYFLMLNISFMFVQMLYGIWTNSLGLISDGTDAVCLLYSQAALKCVSSHSYGLRLYGHRRRFICVNNGDLASKRAVHLWASPHIQMFV